MTQYSQDGDLSRQAMELNILLHAFVESLPSIEKRTFESVLNRSGDFVANQIGETFDYSVRLSARAFEKQLRMAQDAIREIQNQLLAARESRTGDDQSLIKAEIACSELSKSLGNFIRSAAATS